MSRDKKFFILIGIVILLLALSGPAFSEQVPDYYIVDYDYSTHYSPGETVSADIKVVNSTSGEIENAYVNVILTNQATSVETATLDTGPILTIGANSSTWEATDKTTWTAVAGTYSVTIILYSANSLEIRKGN